MPRIYLTGSSLGRGYITGSGVISNPPRTILQLKDNATSSYPTVSRIGDPGRTGRYAINFNDTKSIVFNSNVTTSYPTNLQLADAAYISQSVATPNTNATIEATGIVRKGVADANIMFTPGEDLKPFVDDSLYASTKSAFTDPFYLTGSTVADVGLGFTAPLRSKTKIEIDLNPVSHEVFGFISGSNPVASSSAEDLSEDPNVWPMVYYNFSDRKYQRIGSGMPSATVNGFGLNGTTTMLTKSGTVGFNRGTELISEGLSAQCRPISSFGFPSDTRYHATSSHLYPMSGVLDKPFLVEKFVYEFSAAYSIGNDYSTRDGLFEPVGDGIYENLLDKGRSSILSFFILNQKGPMSTAYPVGPVINLNYNPASSSAGSQASTSFPILIPSSTQLGIAGPYTYVDDYRELVTYGQMNVYTPGTDDVTFMTNAISTGGLGRELNVLGSAENPGITGSYVMSGTVKTTPAFTSGPSYRISKYPDNGTDRFIADTGYQGTRPGINLAGSRGLTSQVPGAKISGSLRDFGVVGIGGTNNTSDNHTITTFANYDITSPYILQPSDNLIFGWQVPMPYGWRRACNAGQGPNMQILPGKGKLTLYGSLVSDHKEHHDGLNQPLTSDAVHEFIGFHGPPLDQFDTEPRQQFSGSMFSNVVTGSTNLSNGRRIFAQKSNAEPLSASNHINWEYSAWNEVSTVYPKFKIQTFSRLIDCNSTSDIFYDSIVPKTTKIASANGTTFLGAANGSWMILGDKNRQTVQRQDSTNDEWFRQFPFEPKFSNIDRETSANIGETVIDTDGLASRFIGFAYAISPDTSYIIPRVIQWKNPMNFVAAMKSESTSIKVINSPTSTNDLSLNYDAIKLLFYSIGDSVSGSCQLSILKQSSGTSLGGQGPLIRGFKYGLFHANHTTPSVKFVSNQFGQMRNMLEQRLDTRFYSENSGRSTISSSPVQVRFVSSDGTSESPSKTSCSNLSQFVTSSLPYFDGVARNRGPIVTADLGLSIVSI